MKSGRNIRHLQAFLILHPLRHKHSLIKPGAWIPEWSMRFVIFWTGLMMNWEIVQNYRSIVIKAGSRIFHFQEPSCAMKLNPLDMWAEISALQWIRRRFWNCWQAKTYMITGMFLWENYSRMQSMPLYFEEKWILILNRKSRVLISLSGMIKMVTSGSVLMMREPEWPWECCKDISSEWEIRIILPKKSRET